MAVKPFKNKRHFWRFSNIVYLMVLAAVLALRFAKFSILTTSSLEVESFLCYLSFFLSSLVLLSFFRHKSFFCFIHQMKKVSLSFGWRRPRDSHRAKLRRDSITVCCRFFLYDDNSLFSCQGQRKNFFFFLLFCQDDEDDEGYFGSSLTFVGQILFCYARFVLSSAKISSLMRVGGVASSLLCERKTTTLMNMSANVGEFLQKTTSRNPYKKNQTRLWKMTTCNQPFMQLSLARFLKIIEKVSFNIASEASYVYILNGQKLIKNE